MFFRLSRWSRLVLGLASLATTAASVCVLSHSSLATVRFLELEQDRLSFTQDPLSWSAASKYLHGLAESGFSSLAQARAAEPDLEDPIEMFSYVFERLPRRARIYPTEGFYYFSAELGGERVRGNLRLADAESKGEISFAYFESREGGGGRTWILNLDEPQGLGIDSVGDHRVELTWRGKRVHFELPQGTLAVPGEGVLQQDERAIGRVFDEAGVAFHLLFNERTRSFYNVLDETCPSWDPLVDKGDGLLVGARTNFAYFADPVGRKVLIGVHLRNVEENNFFDGPGDQVPYEAFLRDSLYMAYPQTLLGAGIDDHGVYLDKPEWVRIAICPFHRYVRLDTLRSRIQRVEGVEDPGERAAKLTKEWWYTPRWLNGIKERLAHEGKLDPNTGSVRQELIDRAVEQRIKLSRSA